MLARLAGHGLFGLLGLDQATQPPPQLMCVFFDDGIVRHSLDGSIGPAQGQRNRRSLLEQTIQFRVKFSQFPIHG